MLQSLLAMPSAIVAVVSVAALLLLSLCCSTCRAGTGGGQCDKDTDVLILGAGVAGLKAAATLSKAGVNDFLILDQLDRIGGRVWSESFGGATVELGAQWIVNIDFGAPEEIQNPLIPLIGRCNITFRPLPLGGLQPFRTYDRFGNDVTAQVGGALARYLAAVSQDVAAEVIASLPPDGNGDLPVTQGLRLGGWDPQTQVDEHAEFLLFDFATSISADLGSYVDNYSPLLLQRRLAMFGPSPLSYIVTNDEGYAAFPHCIADEFGGSDDLRLMLGTVVTDVMWGDDDCVCVTTDDARRLCASYAILTFSVASLQSGVVRFVPELPFTKRVVLNQFEMGDFLKVFLEFNETFWDTDAEFVSYLDSTRARNTGPVFTPWGSFFPGEPHILEVFYSGEDAKRVGFQDLPTITANIMEVLRNIYGERASEPVDAIMHDFITSPFFLGDFTAGAVNLGRRQYDEINVPCGNLYFAGEAYNSIEVHSTVHSAILHGETVANRILMRIQGPLTVTFVDETPRVEGDTIFARFTTSKPTTRMECIVNAQRPRVDCSSGEVQFSGLEDGRYLLRVVARIESEGGQLVERGSVSSKVRVLTNSSECAAHLVNGGVSVLGRRASVEFSSSGLPTSGFSCSLDGVEPAVPCGSPHVLGNLAPGQHRLRITPTCGRGMATRQLAMIEISEE